MIKASKKLKNQDGAVLVSVIMLLVVAALMTATIVNSASFEVKHSKIDENRTKAYYLARSAVSAVVEAVEDEVNEYKTLQTNLTSAVNNLNSFDTGDVGTTPYIQAVAAYQVSLNAFTQKKTYIDSNVIPSQSSTFIHSVDTVNALNDTDVDITNYGTFLQIKSSATVNGSTSRVKLNMNVDTTPYNYDVTLYQQQTSETDVTTTTTIPSGNPGSFADPLYTFNDMTIDNNAEFYEDIKNKNNPSIAKHEGNANGKQKIKVGDVQKVNTPATIVTPLSLLPINVSVDTRYQTVTSSSLPNTITPAQNGFYGPIVYPSGNYTIDTSSGNVVIKVERLDMSGNNNVNFNVIGNNMFYIYIDDNNLSDGGLVFGSKNNVTFTSHDNKARTMIVINPKNANDNNNNIDFDAKNKFTFYGYIYAPYSSLQIKNSSEIYGSVVVNNATVKNNLEIIHLDVPNTSSYGTDGSGNQVITVVTKQVTTNVISSTVQNGPFSVPVALEKNWLRE